eukprot:350435-Chlamydomonas_euryale.AAC.2
MDSAAATGRKEGGGDRWTATAKGRLLEIYSISNLLGAPRRHARQKCLALDGARDLGQCKERCIYLLLAPSTDCIHSRKWQAHSRLAIVHQDGQARLPKMLGCKRVRTYTLLVPHVCRCTRQHHLCLLQQDLSTNSCPYKRHGPPSPVPVQMRHRPNFPTTPETMRPHLADLAWAPTPGQPTCRHTKSFGRQRMLRSGGIAGLA